MIAEHLLWAVTFQSLDNVGTEGSTGLYNVKIFYEWSSENRFFQPSCLLSANDAIMGCFRKTLIIKQ